MTPVPEALRCVLSISRTTFSSDVLSLIARNVAEALLLPEDSLSIAAREDKPANPLHLNDVAGSIAAAGLGLSDKAILTSRARKSLSVFLSGSTRTDSPLGNRISLELLEPTRADAPMLLSFLRAQVARCPCKYGYAGLRQEFENQNIDRSHGVRALGVNLMVSLPGVYWLNFYGPEYLAFRPGTNWRAIHGLEVGGGMLVQAFEDPWSWNEVAPLATKARIRDVIGRDLFFEREAPARPTIAPPFVE